MFDRILVPTDGTPASECAVTNGVELAAKHDAEVHALYVVETDSEMGHVDFNVERMESEGEAAVEAVERRASERGVPVVKALRYGDPTEEILDYVADHDVDLVMMGTAGRTGFERLVRAGSVAERVVRTATVPVMVAGREACRLPDRS
ncbi:MULTISPECIES: universal stress protein [Halorussus]|uniref:universal stress protein n=1 Tax=Halorussus TaxID=1070314 RepID=UPI000E21766C|nr:MULTISPECIES: universal stress protein [Halorussus]NHN58752.1 universal stress protein [Halorussus sp. JP-T4]